MKTGKIMAAMLSVVVLLSACGDMTYSIRLSEAQIEKQLQKTMPIEIDKDWVMVTLTEPKVDLIGEGGRIAIATKAEVVALGGLKTDGSAQISGQVSYDPSSGAFYISEPVIDSFSLKLLPEEQLTQLRELAQVVLAKALANYPVYELDPSDFKERLAKSTLRSVSVEGDHLLLEVGFSGGKSQSEP